MSTNAQLSFGSKMFRRINYPKHRWSRMNVRDLTRVVFGKWTVLGERRREFKTTTWKCQCTCGGIYIVKEKTLLAGESTQCVKCGRYDRGLPEGRSALNIVISRYKNGAAKRGLEWEISLEEFEKLSKLPCAYCGAPPSLTCPTDSGPRLNGQITYNGIDRVDNGKGYSLANCVPCCKTCNLMKRGMSPKDFSEHINKIYVCLKLAGNGEP